MSEEIKELRERMNLASLAWDAKNKSLGIGDYAQSVSPKQKKEANDSLMKAHFDALPHHTLD